MCDATTYTADTCTLYMMRIKCKEGKWGERGRGGGEGKEREGKERGGEGRRRQRKGVKKKEKREEKGERDSRCPCAASGTLSLISLQAS